MPEPLTLIHVEPRDDPKCELCGVSMRLYGVEAHPILNQIELWTYVCPCCDEVQTAAVSGAQHKHYQRTL
jgi:hypothetical protein